MLKTIRTSIGFAVPIFFLMVLIQFIALLLPAQFLPNEIQIGFPFIFLKASDLYGNINQVWNPVYHICDFFVVCAVIFTISTLLRHYIAGNKPGISI